MRIKSSEWAERLQPVSRAEESIETASFGDILLLLKNYVKGNNKEVNFKSSQMLVSTSLMSIGGQFHWNG